MGSMRAQNFVGRMDGSEKTAQRVSGFHSKQREECNQSRIVYKVKELLLGCVGRRGRDWASKLGWDQIVKNQIFLRQKSYHATLRVLLALSCDLTIFKWLGHHSLCVCLLLLPLPEPPHTLPSAELDSSVLTTGLGETIPLSSLASPPSAPSWETPCPSHQPLEGCSHSILGAQSSLWGPYLLVSQTGYSNGPHTLSGQESAHGLFLQENFWCILDRKETLLKWMTEWTTAMHCGRLVPVYAQSVRPNFTGPLPTKESVICI